MKFFKKLKNLFVKKRSYYPEEKGTDGEGKKAVSNKSGLKRFNYSYDGTIGGNNCSYDLRYENGVPVLRYESMEHPDYGEMKTEIGEDVVDTLNNIYLNLRIAEWNGYSKYNPEVCDGEGFSLSMGFNDGKSLSASGTNAFPPGYGAFCAAMERVLEPIRDRMLERERQKKIEEGLHGRLESILACFKQKGASGDDDYFFMIMNKGLRKRNYEIRVDADSGDFFPAGKTSICREVPDEYTALDKVYELIEKYDLIKWYDYDETAPDYGDREWFQLSLGFDDGLSINAMGSEPPENYDAFRADFLRVMADAAEKVKELPKEQ
ncbi:MAG: hypothetical protein J5585_00525 [Clostridia bacterium]|nr:hypothetical protein [Clostridia bacterium]